MQCTECKLCIVRNNIVDLLMRKWCLHVCTCHWPFTTDKENTVDGIFLCEGVASVSSYYWVHCIRCIAYNEISGMQATDRKDPLTLIQGTKAYNSRRGSRGPSNPPKQWKYLYKQNLARRTKYIYLRMHHFNSKMLFSSWETPKIPSTWKSASTTQVHITSFI